MVLLVRTKYIFKKIYIVFQHHGSSQRAVHEQKNTPRLYHQTKNQTF